MKKATLIRDVSSPDVRGDAYVGKPVQLLYRLEPPIVVDDRVIAHVVVSANVVMGRPETYIFSANAEGKILDWGELEGSFQGGLDHEEALRGAGYLVEVVAAPQERTGDDG